MNGNVEDSFIKILLENKNLAVDSAVFIYQLEEKKPFFDLTNIVFSLFSKKKINLCTSVLTLSEILVKPAQNNDEMTVRRLKDTFLRMEDLSVIPVDTDLATASAMVRGKYGLRLPDAIQVATAIYGGAGAIVTNDEKFKKITGLKVIYLADYI